jgi:hypothetical protein
MVLTTKLVIAGLAAAALIFGGVKGCDQWNARQREKADRERRVADSTAAYQKARDKQLDSLVTEIRKERIKIQLSTETALNRAGRDRATRVVEYRTITDPAALALLHRKDTIIDTLTVALEREREFSEKTMFVLDTMIVSRGRWIAAYEARTREAEALRKITPSWWKERIKPRATVGYGAVLAKSGTVQHGFGAQVGFQIFP